tara:strand:- start:486 stop:1751 length:1266 start_codon:yes stop_codon:yes gene_type:complete
VQISFLNKFFLSKNYKVILLILILLLIFYRSPYIFFTGRFVAEEGSFWFHNSYLYGPIKGLTQIFWGSGYIMIWPNLAATFALLVPIEYAPLVTVYFALSVKIFLFVFVIYSQSNFLITNFDKTIISLVILASPPMVPEIWANTLTTQVYFTIFSILILFLQETKENFFNKSSPYVLFFSGLSSLLTCTLTPFFFYKYLKNKNKINLINFITILFVSCFQSVIFIYSKIQNLDLEGNQTRFILSLDKLVNYTYNVLIKSFIGRDLTQSLYYNFFISVNIYLLTGFITLIFIIVLKYSSQHIKNDGVLISLISIFIIISVFTIFGSKMEQVQGRFAVLPGVLLIFIAYRFFQLSFNYFYLILILFTLMTGFYEFKLNNKYPHFLVCIDCPNWKDELGKWKLDKNYKLKIWMYPDKTMKLIKY